jgi:amino acid transporter
MSDITPQYRLEMDRERLSHLYELVRDRRKAVSDIALLGMKNLILLNGGAVVALFTLLGHFDQLTVSSALLQKAFSAFIIGAVLALSTILVGFVSSNLSWLGEQAGGDFIYFHHIGDPALSAARKDEETKWITGSTHLWKFAALVSVLSLISFAAGSDFALKAVSIKTAVSTCYHKEIPAAHPNSRK